MRFETEAEIDQLMAAFEGGTLPKGDWTHQAHVAVAGAYVWNDPDTALPLIRLGILSLNRCHGTVNSATSGYHETLTVFWLSIIRAFCAERRDGIRLQVLNELVASLPADLFRTYYGFDIVRSREAREHWVSPDLKKLP